MLTPQAVFMLKQIESARLQRGERGESNAPYSKVELLLTFGRDADFDRDMNLSYGE